MNKNRLPKYYCFKNNMNHPRWNEVKDRFNERHNERWHMDVIGYYYGFDGSESYDGTNYFSNPRYFQNNPIEITMDQFLEMTEPHKTWTLEEFREGKVAIEWNKKDNGELLNKAMDVTFLQGNNRYYWFYKKDIYCRDVNERNLPTCSVNDIIFHSKQTNMNKKLLGYKPKPTTKFEWYSGFTSYTKKGVEEEINRDGYWFIENTSLMNTLKEAGVLDIWFDKVYEEEKKIFTLDCEGGSFELEISKEGIYYKPDNVWLDTNSLRNYINGRDFIPNLKGSVKPKDGSNKQTYTVQYSHINLGCKKHVPISQLKEVVDHYKSLYN